MIMNSRSMWTLVVIFLSFTIKAVSEILCSLSDPSNCNCVKISQSPQDTSAVFENSVTLACRVDNVIGREVQWTKGGVALGVDPTIPGYPRYRMADTAGNTLAGNYDLIISNVQLEDEDFYQCQVTQCNVQSGAAFVTVLVPPYGPVIIDEEPDGEYRVVAYETISIICEAWNAKPPADVSWFKGNDQITEGVQKVIYESESALSNSSATLTLTPNLTDDKEIYTCIMNNDALIAKDPAVIPAQKNDIIITVLVPPSEPTIDDYDPSGGIINVKEYDPITVTCRAENGKPAPGVDWYREAVLIAENVDHETAPADIYGRQNVSAYLRLIGNASDDNIKFTCSVSSEAWKTPSTISFILEVSSSMSPAIIAAIVIGVVLLLLLLIILTRILCKQRKKKEEAALENAIQPEIELRAETQNGASTILESSESSSTSAKKEAEIAVITSGSESSEAGEVNVAYAPTSSEDSDDETAPPQYSSPISSSETTSQEDDDMDDLQPPEGDVFSLSSSLRRSDRGSPVDDFFQEDLEILSVPSPYEESWMTGTTSTIPQYIVRSPAQGMITNV